MRVVGRRRTFFQSAVFKSRKDNQAPADTGIYGIAGDARQLVLTCATGEVWSGSPEHIAGELLELPRHAKVFVTPENGRDISRWLNESLIYDAMTAAGMKAQLCLSGTNVVAVRLFKTIDREQPHAVIVSLRNYDPSTQYLEDAHAAAALSCRKGKHCAWAIFEQFGTSIGLTPASTAYNAFRRALDSDRAHFRPHRIAINEGLRESYYGGAVWSSRRTVRNVRMYDMRGAYAWAMRQGVPIGRPVYTLEEEPDTPGFYHVRAYLNPEYPSPFMVRGESFKGPGTTASTGVVTETWATSAELELCREWFGTYEVLEGWIFPDGIEYLFDTFINKIDQAERNSTGIARVTAKLLRNSLYGRFGRRPTLESVVIAAEQPGDDYGPHYGQRGPIGQMWSTHIDDDNTTAVMPHWAAWLTSLVRCRLLRAWQALRDAGHDVYYLDTDCIITNGTLPTGNNFGDWQVRHVFDVFQVFASKVYAGFDSALNETILAHAGIPRAESDRIIERFESAHLMTKKPP